MLLRISRPHGAEMGLKHCFKFSVHFAALKVPGKCSFNHKWLTMEDCKWVRQVKGDSKKALCIVCNKTITLTMMGEKCIAFAHGEK